MKTQAKFEAVASDKPIETLGPRRDKPTETLGPISAADKPIQTLVPAV